MNFKLLPVLFSVFTMLSMPMVANAQQQPNQQGSDGRIQTFDYDKTDVYIINSQVGYSTLIQLEEDEIIPDNGGLGMGDAKAWSLEVRANNIFFKPVKQLPDTNMLLVTNKRTYAFQLTTNGGIPTYIARFNYPQVPTQQETVLLPRELKKAGITKDGLSIFINADVNTDYYYRGDNNIKPTNAWDDGRFTYLKYAHAGDLPVVYRVMDDGSETIVNSHVEKDILVIQEKGSIYRLRFNNTVGDVSSTRIKGTVDYAEFNETGTSNSDFQRINK